MSAALGQVWPLHGQQQELRPPFPCREQHCVKPCCWMRYPMVTYTEPGKHRCVLLHEKQPASAVLGAACCWSGPVSLLKEKGGTGLKSRWEVPLFPQAGALCKQPYPAQPWGLQSLRWLPMCLRLYISAISSSA